ncbi:NADPH-dependent F420 reductase [Jeotgalibaca sp. A127]|uniref:NADPH-dependent F420 reductase n=1 Tax=Jeotgalibaca sp. A127 TaxID=3457324 RepID=UPI003FD6A7B7
MSKISIFGSGNMGSALKARFEDAGNSVEFIGREDEVKPLGDIVVFAVPYPSVKDIIKKYKAELTGKIIVDITNPLDFNTFDDLVVPADSSATAEIAKELPDSHLLKAFNTTFAAVLANKTVGDNVKPRVLVAGDSESAKEKLIDAVEGSGLDILDAGKLKRARELEAVGFLNISLAAAEKISWSQGFHLYK